jgi:drug/metabolite transporter (DMT)-like permease
MLLWLNVRYKKVLWDSLQTDEGKMQIPSFLTRLVQGNISITVNFITVKYFSLSTVAIAMNLAPLFTALFGSIFLKEQMTLL